MKTILLILALALPQLRALAQGQVVFANKVGSTVDAPVIDWRTSQGPGPNFTAGLYLQEVNGSLTALAPTATFRAAGLGAAAIADRYWNSQTVEIPSVAPGTVATFVVRAWQTSYGSFENSRAGSLQWGESAPFAVTVGGGILPPANLTSLQGFTLVLPEPGTLPLAALGLFLFLVTARK